MSGPVVECRFEASLLIERLLPILEELASSVAGRTLVWEPLERRAWRVERASRAASAASRVPLVSGGALPNLREPPRFLGTPTELALQLLGDVGRDAEATRARSALQLGDLPALRDLHASMDRPEAFPPDDAGRLAGALALGAVQLAMDVLRADERTIESSFMHLCRQRAMLARARGDTSSR